MRFLAARRSRPRLAAALLSTVVAASAAATPAPAAALSPAGPQSPAAASSPLDLAYPEPTPVTRIWRELGERAGMRIVFDPHLPEKNLAIDLRGATPEEAMALLSLAAGHFTRRLASGGLLVIRDSPRERQEHEELALRQLALEHADLPQAMTMLRAMLDMRRLAPNPAGDAIVVRDTLPKVELAARLIELFDRPAAEVEVDVDRLTVDAAALRALSGGAGDGSPVRVPAGRLAGLAGGDARRLTTLSALSGDRASYEASGAHAAADPAASDLELSVEPRVHGETGEITLDVAARAVHRAGPAAVAGSRKLTSSLRIGDGAAFLLVGLLPEAAATPGRVTVLALTPRIVRASGLRPADLETVYAGTYARSALRGSGESGAEAAEADASP